MDQMRLIEAKFKALSPRLDEASLRLWAAAEARSLGRGGVSLVAKAVGLSRTTIYAGMAEIEASSKRKGPRKSTAQIPGSRRRHTRSGARWGTQALGRYRRESVG